MDILKITSEDLKTYQYLSEGIESVLYYKDDILIKKYDEINENLINKIKAFYSLGIPKVTLPKRLVSIDNKILGFTMHFKRGYYPISNIKMLSIDKKINILKKVKNILDGLHQNNIIYGDLNINNVITNDDDVYLCDIVNAKTDKYNFNSSSKLMRKYEEQANGYDRNLDNYMLNILTIYLLNDMEYDEVLEAVEETIVKKFNNIPCEDIIGLTDNLDCMDIGYKLLNPSSPNDKLLLDYIDEELYKTRTK